MDWDAREKRAADLTGELRERIAADAGAIMIFLGAGLSYGVGRQLGRAAFELPAASVDERRFPSWSQMIDRMQQELVAGDGDDATRAAIGRFFADQDQLDCAQLYRQRVGEERYQTFLREQFEARLEDLDAQEVERPRRHLIKLHGDIERAETIILTRDDYANSRLARAGMFRHFEQQARFSSFLFIGFSLRDPTFNLLRDEARMVMGRQPSH
jgi:SIR2-like domain